MVVWWWIGLIGAWVAILAIVKLVLLVLRVLKHIRRLAEGNAQTAARLAEGMEAARRVAAVADTGERLGQAAAGLAAEAEAVERAILSLSQAADGGSS